MTAHNGRSAETTTRCPSWCDHDHPAGAGAVHRHVVGHVAVPGGRIPVRVVILQSPGYPALVTIAGGVFVEIHDDGRTDMAELLTVLGHADLAALVRQATEIVRGADRPSAAQHDADPAGECVAEFIDGSWTYADCDCIECRTRLAEDSTSGEEL